jgi:hypothetical protein
VQARNAWKELRERFGLFVIHHASGRHSAGLACAGAG